MDKILNFTQSPNFRRLAYSILSVILFSLAGLGILTDNQVDNLLSQSDIIIGALVLAGTNFMAARNVDTTTVKKNKNNIKNDNNVNSVNTYNSVNNDNIEKEKNINKSGLPIYDLSNTSFND